MKHKICSLNISLYNKEIWIEKLERLSLKGWVFDQVKLSYGVLKKAEPRKRKYAIQLFEPNKRKTKFFGEKLIQKEEEKENYISYCEEAGWNYIGSFNHYLIFYTEVEDAIEIQTDKEIERKQIKQEFTKHSIPMFLIWLLYIKSMIQYGNIFSHHFTYKELLSCLTLILIPCLSLIFLYAAIPWIGDIFYFIKKNNGKNKFLKVLFYLQKWVFYFGILLLIGAFYLDLYYGKIWIVFEIFGAIITCMIIGYIAIILWRKFKIEEKKFGFQIACSLVGCLCLFGGFIGIVQCLDMDIFEQKADDWKAKVTIEQLIGNGVTTLQTKEESPFIKCWVYEGEEGNTTLRYMIYKRKMGDFLFQKGIQGEIDELKIRAKTLQGRVYQMTEENWGSREVYGIKNSDWDFIVERRLFINNDYAMSIYMMNSNGKEISIYEIMNQIREQIVIPLQKGNEQAVLGI